MFLIMLKINKNLLKIGIGTLGTYSFFKYQRDNITDNILVPVLNKIDPEKAHNLTIKLMKYNLIPEYKKYSSQFLENNLLNINFKNPVGLAAGFDKNAEAFKSLDNLGFGFIELGSVTIKPQSGNESPRIFRYDDNKIIINNCGLNNKGVDVFLDNISAKNEEILGVNIAINNDSKNIISEYHNLNSKLIKFADYFVINLSCPNTEGNLQNKKTIEEIFKSNINRKSPILYKLSPNLSKKMIYEISRLSLKYEVDGLIISNTKKCYLGGISGKPLTDLSKNSLEKFYKYTNGKIPLIGVGGIMNSRDAYNRILSGASLIQVYSGFIFEGPKIIYNINKDIELFLIRDGFSNIKEAIGSNVYCHETIIDKINNKLYDLYLYTYENIEDYVNS